LAFAGPIATHWLMLGKLVYLSTPKFDVFQIKTIFGALPKEKQTLMFSATMTDTLEKVKLVASKKVC